MKFYYRSSIPRHIESICSGSVSDAVPYVFILFPLLSSCQPFAYQACDKCNSSWKWGDLVVSIYPFFYYKANPKYKRVINEKGIIMENMLSFIFILLLDHCISKCFSRQLGNWTTGQLNWTTRQLEKMTEKGLVSFLLLSIKRGIKCNLQQIHHFYSYFPWL